MMDFAFPFRRSTWQWCPNAKRPPKYGKKPRKREKPDPRCLYSPNRFSCPNPYMVRCRSMPRILMSDFVPPGSRMRRKGCQVSYMMHPAPSTRAPPIVKYFSILVLSATATAGVLATAPPLFMPQSASARQSLLLLLPPDGLLLSRC